MSKALCSHPIALVDKSLQETTHARNPRETLQCAYQAFILSRLNSAQSEDYYHVCLSSLMGSPVQPQGSPYEPTAWVNWARAFDQSSHHTADVVACAWGEADLAAFECCNYELGAKPKYHDVSRAIMALEQRSINLSLDIRSALYAARKLLSCLNPNACGVFLRKLQPLFALDSSAFVSGFAALGLTMADSAYPLVDLLALEVGANPGQAEELLLKSVRPLTGTLRKLAARNDEHWAQEQKLKAQAQAAAKRAVSVESELIPEDKVSFTPEELALSGCGPDTDIPADTLESPAEDSELAPAEFDYDDEAYIEAQAAWSDDDEFDESEAESNRAEAESEGADDELATATDTDVVAERDDALDESAAESDGAEDELAAAADSAVSAGGFDALDELAAEHADALDKQAAESVDTVDELAVAAKPEGLVESAGKVSAAEGAAELFASLQPYDHKGMPEAFAQAGIALVIPEQVHQEFRKANLTPLPSFCQEEAETWKDTDGLMMWRVAGPQRYGTRTMGVLSADLLRPVFVNGLNPKCWYGCRRGTLAYTYVYPEVIGERDAQGVPLVQIIGMDDLAATPRVEYFLEESLTPRSFVRALLKPRCG